MRSCSYQSTEESIMMKFLLWAVIIIFVIGLLVVTGMFSLIF